MIDKIKLSELKGGKMMVVEVIVDIPASQVNQTFDYKVEEEWQDLIQLGIRVEVPFGSRQLLGFVVGIKTESQFEGQLRPISKVMDYMSFLNDELIQLSDYLAKYLQAFRISILQAMLPSMLRVTYTNVFIVKDMTSFKEFIHSISLENFPIKEEYEKDFLESILTKKQIKKLLNENILELEYQVLNKVRAKKVKKIIILKKPEEYKQIYDATSNHYHRQKQLLSFLMKQTKNDVILQTSLIKEAKINNSVIKSAESKGWISSFEEEVYREVVDINTIDQTKSKKLLNQQQKAFDTIVSSIHKSESKTYLLEGVTGSGKTEVYLQLIAEVVEEGKTAILLVPEISLTPQMVERVVGRFGMSVAILHSGLSMSEKYDEWQRIIKGEAQIVVGARSSIFAPLNRLGLIIIDEEHETTYKQSDNPRYHARDVALWRSQYHHCPLVLGSATPSLESRARAEVGNYQLVMMDQRINQNPLPPIKLVDMTEQMVTQTHNEFSLDLTEAIQERLDRKEQIVLMLNRRGYASYILCRSCGYVFDCPRCDISLTYHKVTQQMKCHYCDFKQAVPKECPKCLSEYLRKFGLGTQKVMETLSELFPQARVIRMDNDTTRRKGDHKRLLEAFGNQEADILLGTQMIAKGLDFEKVTLVGVINADTSLNLPDFRASEKTFQLLTQVSGRTGRGSYKGEVIIQTYNPDHYVMHFAQSHDYEGFFYYEMKRRHLANYPPYYFTTLVTVKSKNQGKAMKEVYDLRAQLLNVQQQAKKELIVLGPSQGAVARINEYYQFQLLLKYKNKDIIQSQLNDILIKSQEKVRYGLYIGIDHEPQYFI